MLIKHRNHDIGVLLTRLGLSLVFIYEGLSKISSFDKTAMFFGSLGFNAVMLYFIIAAELIAGIVMLLGIFPEWGYVIAIEMAVVIFRVQLPHGFGHIFYELMVLLAGLQIALSGPGKYSLEHAIKSKRSA